MFIFFILILFISITLHEYFHGWMASKLGDPTPKESGRLTLNPLAHIDPFGTIILPFLLLMLSRGAFSFGYAKPVPINPYHFKNPKKDIMWVGLAGPLANFFIVFCLVALLKIGISFFPQEFTAVIIQGIFINLVLGMFNLIPIPPLDGSKIAASFLSNKLYYQYLKMERVGFLIILLLMAAGFFRWVLFYAIFPFTHIILYLFGIKGVEMI